MSLINDALRKARQAASERDARQPEILFRGRRIPPPRSHHRGIGKTTILLIALAAGLAGAGGVWWFVDRTSTPAVSRQQAKNTTATAGENQHEPLAAALNSASPEDTISAELTLTPASPVKNPPESNPVDARAGQDEQGVDTRDDIKEGRSTVAETSISETRKSTEHSGQASGERIFVLDAELGYATLSLGYIVFRPVDPFAEINGQEIHLGSEVEGFVVEKIESDRVVLSDTKGPLELRVH